MQPPEQFISDPGLKCRLLRPYVPARERATVPRCRTPAEILSVVLGMVEAYTHRVASALIRWITTGRRDWLPASPGRCPANESRKSSEFVSTSTSVAR